MRTHGNVGMWPCPNCTEQVDDQFDVCWNCGTAKDGTTDPDFRVERALAPQDESEDVEPIQFRIGHILALTALVAVVSAVGLSVFLKMFVGAVLSLVMFTLFGFAFWFLVWTLVYLVVGSRGFTEKTKQDGDSQLPVNVWHARNQLAEPAEVGEEE